MAKKRNMVEWAMHYRQLVITVVCCLIAFGIYSLPNMRKNEFPDFTIRQGIIVAVAPGNTAQEMEEQVTKPLEDYIFSYKEVKKEKTYSMSQDGIVYIQVQLNDELNNKDEFWSKFKHGVQEFKSNLPQNVMAVIVKDDFGDTSSLLITMESQDKTYRELSQYMDRLQDRLRTIESVGRLTVSGMQEEQISVTLNNDRLAKYGLSDQTVALSLFQKGFTTTGGRIKSQTYSMPVHVAKSLNSVYDIQQQIVYSSPTGDNVRLKDIATVKREYPDADSRITSNGKKCILLSLEMKKGYNVVKMGEDIDKEIAAFQKTLPSEVGIYRITDQSKVVDDSITNFLKELVIAIVAVVIVVMLLLPMRVALVAASTIPVSIFISLGLFNAFGMELNTVTLAALIVTLGMIVDNSIVIIDNYLEQLGEGKSRWHASIASATHFFKSIFSATCAISITFFPFLITCTGQTYDFLASFPWAVSIVLGVSLLVASLLVPFMQYYFIRKPLAEKPEGKKSFSFLDLLQKYYDKLLSLCISWPKTTLALGVGTVILGLVMMNNLPQQTMPTAERNQLAVEIYLPTGTSLEKTSTVADSLEHMLRHDKRIVSITSFKGCASPRFHTAYAPQMGGTNYAQFIVNTVSTDATVEVLNEYSDKYAAYFPEAHVKFKQLSYNEATCPVEVRLSNTDTQAMMADAAKVEAVMHTIPELQLIRTNFNTPQATTTIRLKEEEAARLGITNAMLEATLAMRYGSGVSLASVWEGDKQVAVMLKSTRSDRATTDNLADEPIPVMGGLKTVPLRQVADIVPTTQYGQRVRRNGVPTITVMAEVKRGVNVMAITTKLQEKLKDTKLADGTRLVYGGDYENGNETMGPTMAGLGIAAVMIFFILMIHFRKIKLAAIIFASMLLSVFGACVGLNIQGLPFGVTCVMGLTALMGIIVRNGIIMYDYAEELREGERMSVRDAIWHSASRRMRPIFLTSAAASMGVIPMILGGSGLWMPMGTVICYGTLISMLLILTVVPVTYLIVLKRKER
jgi:multidrug efflux pump